MKALSITLKDFQILIKDRGSLIMSFLVPVVFILVFSIPQLASSSEGDDLITLPVVNLDAGSEASQEFIEGLNTVGGVRVELYEQEQARALLEEGEISELLEIPADFAAMGLEHPVTLRLTTHPDADEVQSRSVFMVINGVAQDMALKNQLFASFEQMGDMLRGSPDQYQVFSLETSVAQAESQFERSKTEPLVTIEQTTPAIRGEPEELTGTQLNVPGFTVLFVFLTAQNTAMSIFTEKKQGSFRRLLAAPMGRAALLIGKMLPNLVATLVQIIVIFAVGVFGLPLLGLAGLSLGHDPLALILVSLLVALCSTAVGVLLSALAHTQAQAGGLSAVVLWVMGALGGAFFPTFLLGGPLGTLSKAVPHSWALRAYYDLFVHGRGLADVVPEMAVLLGFSVVFFAIGVWRFDFD